MHRRGPVLAVACALALAVVPLASAQWQSNLYEGVPEPNTAPDTDPDVMFQDANDEERDRIYFDVMVDQTGGVPRVHTEHTSVRNYATAQFHALLGYWRDCNDDGFIGDAVSGSMMYPVGQGSASVCPSTSPYSDGVTMIEFLAIGPEANKDFDAEEYTILCNNNVLCAGGHASFVRDDFAKVWHDWDLPTDPPAPTRAVTPLPQGSYSDTNGHFYYVDSLTFGSLSGDNPEDRCNLAGQCWVWPSTQGRHVDADGRQRPNGAQCNGDANGDGITDDPVGNAVTGVTTQSCSPVPNVPNPVTATARDRWNDSANPNQGGSTIVEPYEWGSKSSPECEQKADLGLSDANTDGAVYPTWDHLYRSAVLPAVTGDPSDGCSRKSEDKAPSVIGANLERPFTPADIAKKVAPNTGFGFSVNTFFNPSETGGMVDAELCVPSTGALTRGHACVGYWTSGGWILSSGTTRVNPIPFETFISTFYADVNFASPFGPDRYSAPAGLDDSGSALPAGADNAHTYGAEECRDGVSLTWDCDAQAWIDATNIDQGAPNADELIHGLVKVLDPYDLRDVECFDNRVLDTSVNAVVRDLTSGLKGDRACSELPVNLG